MDVNLVYNILILNDEEELRMKTHNVNERATILAARKIIMDEEIERLLATFKRLGITDKKVIQDGIEIIKHNFRE